MVSLDYENEHFSECPMSAKEKDWVENPVCRCDSIMSQLDSAHRSAQEDRDFFFD